ncbi:hypothetical protein POTOM_030716 [Populus tomentosa]|uniref:Uncharacterized protein n=1 Tax=Populus tomentosa TaxID=118781 RepID=A0A8X7Z8N7_POPTO|nr:hypothetical protein POTOM_030716 [Populus tomentosa]
MLSSKLLPEMEVDYNSKSEQWLQGMQNLPILSQIERDFYLSSFARIDMTAAACESAEKVLEDTRRTYHPSFVLHACRPTCIWRPEADYISTCSALGRGAGCLMECIAFLILLNEQSQMHDLQGQAQQKFLPFCLVIRNSNMLLEIPNMSSTISSQLLVPLLQNGRLSSAFLIGSMQGVYNTGVSNPGGVMPIQQQQLGSQEAFVCDKVGSLVIRSQMLGIYKICANDYLLCWKFAYPLDFESSQNAVSRNSCLKFSRTMVEKKRLQHM